MVTIQNYVRAGSLEEAYELNQKRTQPDSGGNAVDENAEPENPDSD